MKNIFYICILCIFFSCKNEENKTIKNSITEIPLTSIYNVKDTFITQDNERITLEQFKNKPTVISMIFTNCTYACPRLTLDVSEIEKGLKEKSDDVNYVMISFDTERDTPTVLKEFYTKMHLNKNWTFLTGSENAVRKLSVLLNIQFEKDAEGNFSHSNIVSVLDQSGVLVFRKEGLKANHQETINFINNLF